MGFFSGLVTLPLAPVRGAAWVTQQVADEADRQLYDEGKIGDEERAHMEDALFERLEVAREREREERLEAELVDEPPLEGEVVEEGPHDIEERW